MGSEHPTLLHYPHMAQSTLDTLQQPGCHHGVPVSEAAMLRRAQGCGLKLIPAGLRSWPVISASGVLPGAGDGAGPPKVFPPETSL